MTTTIITITVEDSDLSNIALSYAGPLGAEQGVAVCQAATRHFQELAIESEVQRRLKEKERDPREPVNDS